MSKKKNLRIVSIFLVIFILLFAAAVALLYMNKKAMDVKDDTITELLNEINSNKSFVYVATQDLQKGTKVEEGVNVMVQECVTALPESLYMGYEDAGKVLTVDVAKNQPIMDNMLTDEIFDNDTREVEIGVAQLMLDQMVNDYVDIRIMFPDASDYTVVSKIKMKNISLENNLFYANLSEDEIITLSSATLDAYTITGTKIYITRYVEPSLQENAIPNYPVKQETLLLMASDPNILHRAEKTLNAQARSELEARLAMLSEEQLIAINDGHGLVDTAHAKAYLDKTTTDTTIYANEEETTTEGE